MERALVSVLPDVESLLLESLGVAYAVELSSLSEASAETLFQDEKGPLAMLRFQLDGQLGWIQWECVAAVSAIERLLGAGAEASEARALTPVEAKVLGTVLASVAQGIATVHTDGISDPAIVQTPEAIGSWKDVDVEPDPHRICVELALNVDSDASTIRIYLPGLGSLGDDNEQEEADAALPTHLDRVEVSFTAEMAGAELPLSQLLALEEGDVIPCDARVGEPLEALVEGRHVANVVLGTRSGRLAVRIQDFEPKE